MLKGRAQLTGTVAVHVQAPAWSDEHLLLALLLLWLLSKTLRSL